MTSLAEMGAIIAPPIPGFYNQPSTIEDLVDSSVDRILDLLGIPDHSIRRWSGPSKETRNPQAVDSEDRDSKSAFGFDEEEN